MHYEKWHVFSIATLSYLILVMTKVKIKLLSHFFLTVLAEYAKEY